MTETVKRRSTSTWVMGARLRIINWLNGTRGIPPSETIEDALARSKAHKAANPAYARMTEKRERKKYEAQFKGAYLCLLCNRNVYPRAPLLAIHKRCPICGGTKFAPPRMDPEPTLGVQR